MEINTDQKKDLNSLGIKIKQEVTQKRIEKAKVVPDKRYCDDCKVI